MIRLTTEVNGHQVIIEGDADKVVSELETLKKGLNADCCSNGEASEESTDAEDKAPKKSRRKPSASARNSAIEPEGYGARTTAVDDQEAPDPESAPEEESAPEAKGHEITITDLRKAIQGASREQKQAAKQYLIDALGKADLPSLPEDKYPELMELVS